MEVLQLQMGLEGCVGPSQAEERKKGIANSGKGWGGDITL